MIATYQDQHISSKTSQFATFYCGQSILGLDITYVQEINRNLELTRVPLSPKCVRGVMNLRGEVVTMLDLRTLMGIEPAKTTSENRNLILTCDGDTFGLQVDGVADILTIRASDITLPPSNLTPAESRLIRGIYQTEKTLVMLVDPRELFAASLSTPKPVS